MEWFEVITENFLDTEGRPLQILEFMRQDYPISLHGVSLSIAQADHWPQLYLSKLKQLIERIQPFLVSDHLCWTGNQQGNLHNLLPFPYDDESLRFIVAKIDRIQTFLQRPLILENLSAYLSFNQSTYSEWDFLKMVSRQSGCKILLDVNNIYVNSVNQNFDPRLFLEAIEPQSVAEIHLAGFSNMGKFLFDTHDHPVYPQVWDLYTFACQKFADVPVLIEWDDHIPDFPVLEAEAIKAKEIWQKVHAK